MGTKYIFLSILWLGWKFKKNWIYEELIIIKSFNLSWISLNWRNDG
jgi:hypothetical protein